MSNGFLSWWGSICLLPQTDVAEILGRSSEGSLGMVMGGGASEQGRGSGGRKVREVTQRANQLHLGIMFKTPQLQVTGSVLHAAGSGRQIKGMHWAGNHNGLVCVELQFRGLAVTCTVCKSV